MAVAPVVSSSTGAGTIELVARHAIQGTEVKVVLPKRAKFKHIKQALARRLSSDEILTRGQLMKKDAGIYNAFKDSRRIGDVRQVLVVCADFTGIANEEAVCCSLSEGDVSSDDEVAAYAAVGSSAAAGSRAGGGGAEGSTRPGIFTRMQAVALQKELFEGFSEESFQQELLELMNLRGAGELPSTEFAQARQDLFLSVQSHVLPRFGFEGSVSGVYKMMGSMGPFIKDPEFVAMAKRINVLIGLESPPESWGDLSKSCQKLDAVLPEGPSANLMSKAKPSRFGLGIGSSIMQAAFPSPSRGGFMPPPQADLVDDSDDDVDERPSRGGGGGGGVRAGGFGAPRSGQAAPAQPQQQEVDGFQPWPSNRKPPFRLCIAGSWSNFSPTEMEWDAEGGLFVAPILVGATGRESFQLLVNGSFDRTLYPSRPDAGPFEAHQVLGPDARGHGKNWAIGRHKEEEVVPGKNFAVLAALDRDGKVRLVDWQPF